MELDAAATTTCGLHPGVAVTGFCASCLRERLAGLDPNSAASASHPRKSTSALKSFFSRPSHPSSAAPALPELRRCKSFSYRRAPLHLGPEPHRRSCDVRGGPPSLGALFHNEGGQIEACVPEEDEIREVGAVREFLATSAAAPERPMKEHIDQESSLPRKPPHKDLKEIAGSFWVAASVFSKKWQDWRRKQKLKKQQQQQGSKAAAAAMPPERPLPNSHRQRLRQHRFRDTQSEISVDALGRRSCDTDPRFSLDAGCVSFDVPRQSLDEPRASWDAYFVGGSRCMLARLPPMLSVVEDPPVTAVLRSDGQIPVEEDASVPGGTAQTRDYYLDSSSRRRRSFERSVSARKSFSEANEPRLVSCVNANAKVSPAIGTEFYHYHHAQSILDHDVRGSGSSSLQDDVSESFDSAFRDHTKGAPAKKSKKWMKGWNIWGFKQKKGGGGGKEAANVVDRAFSESWPELRARGYNGQMLRCNSSVSARSSFSASAAIGSANTAFGSARRSSVDARVNGQGKARRDEFLLERNRSGRYSPSRADGGKLRLYLNPMGTNQIGRSNGVSGNGRPISSHSLQRSSTLRLY